MESDFVLVTCGFASLLLVFLTWLIDIRKSRNGDILSMFWYESIVYLYSGRCVSYFAGGITVGESSLQEKIYTSIWSVLPDGSSGLSDLRPSVYRIQLSDCMGAVQKATIYKDIEGK